MGTPTDVPVPRNSSFNGSKLPASNFCYPFPQGRNSPPFLEYTIYIFPAASVRGSHASADEVHMMGLSMHVVPCAAAREFSVCRGDGYDAEDGGGCSARLQAAGAPHGQGRAPRAPRVHRPRREADAA